MKDYRAYILWAFILIVAFIVYERSFRDRENILIDTPKIAVEKTVPTPSYPNTAGKE